MDTARRILAMLLVVTVPPAILYWYLIHPLARFWRRLGALKTYLLVVPASTGLGVVLYLARNSLLGADLGPNKWLAGSGLALYALSAAISLRCRKHLRLPVFVGVPEVSGGGGTGKLLQEGIYGSVRHPRYLSFALGCLGITLMCNYVGAYLVWLGSLILLLLLVPLEERELLDRFGDDYAAYRERVPAFIPRRGRQERRRRA